jgi:Niemann-Pick C1 protein
VDFSLALLYILLVSVLLGWVLLQRTRQERRVGSNVEPLLNDMGGEGSNVANIQRDEAHPEEVCT